MVPEDDAWNWIDEVAACVPAFLCVSVRTLWPEACGKLALASVGKRTFCRWGLYPSREKCHRRPARPLALPSLRSALSFFFGSCGL